MSTDDAQHCLEFGGGSIAYRLRRSERRSVRISVGRDLAVTVDAPDAEPLARVQSFVLRKARWILRTRARIERCRPLPRPRRYVSGEPLLYLGRLYRLEVAGGPAGPARLDGACLRAQGAEGSPAVRRAVQAWYQQRAAEAMARSVARCSEVTARHGVPPAVVALRQMKSRWGSCSARGRISLNTRLVQVPPACCEYVVMHEFCHLVHHNHGPGFYALLALCMPDWRERKAALNEWML